MDKCCRQEITELSKIRQKFFDLSKARQVDSDLLKGKQVFHIVIPTTRIFIVYCVGFLRVVATQVPKQDQRDHSSQVGHCLSYIFYYV